ncbi:zinc transporter ZupT [Maridesulfovibrio hydrothermalis]|uniref:Zinc transporter ZupT n=1 Tax=Maridesulfovibrio hydrothermalis AM13 = DSM 14728 TaxID=1121451 RepID=L0RGT2_9BACT|nr:zinc transporter ZupT [Maridesulfovibrio hydrothermalis]CCO25442.1 Zinc transporter ZupT [Maridesulfovibrio hydrothermalis AM13 = DSM 14728]
MFAENALFALGLTLFAGLCTGIGSALAFFAKRTNPGFLSLALGFSAGVMIYVSFMEIMVKAKTALQADLGMVTGTWTAVLAFFGGIAVIAMIDKLVPSYENPHEMRRIEDMNVDGSDSGGSVADPSGSADGNGLESEEGKKKLFRMGTMAALAIGIHNFPEGLATFTAALSDPSLGIAIAVAIAIHNIPEGIAVSVPIYYATGDKKKAFFYSFLSGLAEPVGALVGYLLLMPFMSETVFGVIFAGVAGIMVFISLDELLPAAEEYGEHHLSIYGLVAGMAVMAVSLLLFL